MGSNERIDIFINIHKGLRRALLGMSNKLGCLDWSDKEEVAAVGKEFANILHFLREHAGNENEVQMPPLEERAPGATRKMAEDHERLEKVYDQLESEWDRVSRSHDPAWPGYQLYRNYNRFLSEYLLHMDMEEGEITETIYRHFTDPEIGVLIGRIVKRVSPQDMAMMLAYVIPGLNDAERCTFLSTLKATAPPEVFTGVKGLAQKVLAPKDWEKLSARLG